MSTPSLVRAAGPLLALAALLAAAPAAAAAADAPSEEARARDWFTDTVLLTQEGKSVRFYTDVLREKEVVVLDFIFTRCAGACPVLTEKLNAVRRQLGDLFGAKVRYVSISVDPEHDTPAELAEFARRHRAEHPEWLFLTGTRADVKTVISRLGQWTEDFSEHSTLFIAGSVRAKHWTKIRIDTPTEAFALQVRRLAGEPDPGVPAGAPKS